jgi:hypothetical protein
MHTISVILTDTLYNKLKAIIPNKKISKFVAQAVEEKLSEEPLYKAYAEAYKDKDRNKEINLWNNIDGEHWQ